MAGQAESGDGCAVGREIESQDTDSRQMCGCVGSNWEVDTQHVK